MSVYTPYMSKSQYTPTKTPSPRPHTSNQSIQDVLSNPDLFKSAYYQRPIKNQFLKDKLFPDQKQSASSNQASNNARRLEFKPRNLSPMPIVPDKGLCIIPKYFQSRKSSQQSKSFQSRIPKLYSSKNLKCDNSLLITPPVQVKSNFYYDLSNQANKPPRYSMMENLPAQEQLSGRRIHKKTKGWEEINNFQMDPQINAEHIVIKINIQSPKTKNFFNLPSKHLRKHSDNEGIKRTPAFLLTPKGYNKSECNSPRSKFNIEHFRIVKQLGRGSFGRVVLAIEKETGYICAIKILSKRDLSQENMIQQLVRQIKIQSCLNHPNVIKIYGFFDDLLHFYIVMECALDHRLSDVLQKRRLPQNEAAVVFYQLCSAVSHMHSFTIIHRDLKPENIMLHEQVVKVCDFGWSVYRGGQLRNTFCGTPLYLSPQILMGNPYDESVDVWTLGIILYEMVIGGSPFGITTSQQLVNIVNDKLDLSNKNISSDLKELISLCLQKNSEKRPNVKWLLAQNWVKRGQPEESRRLFLVNY